MARPKKTVDPKTLDQQINDVDAEIESYQQRIREAKDRKKDLTEQKKNQELEALYATIQASGKSVEEIMQLIKNQ